MLCFGDQRLFGFLFVDLGRLLDSLDFWIFAFVYNQVIDAFVVVYFVGDERPQSFLGLLNEIGCSTQLCPQASVLERVIRIRQFLICKLVILLLIKLRIKLLEQRLQTLIRKVFKKFLRHLDLTVISQNNALNIRRIKCVLPVGLYFNHFTHLGRTRKLLCDEVNHRCSDIIRLVHLSYLARQLDLHVPQLEAHILKFSRQ